MLKCTIVLSLILFSFSGATSTNVGVSEFRGYIATNRLLRERLFMPGSSFELGTYIGQEYDPLAGNLLDLLGTYKTGFGVGSFRNGKPNALNMLLWHMLFSDLAKDVSKVCKGGNPIKFNPTFIEKVTPLCHWPNGSALSSTTLYTFWESLMGVEAPLSEFDVWEKFVSSPEMTSIRGEDAVEWLTLSVLNNPYFLLRQ